jgi:hypothetical protein
MTELFFAEHRTFSFKVLSLLEACFDLILGSSLHMKIQIMGGKITENLGYIPINIIPITATAII